MGPCGPSGRPLGSLEVPWGGLWGPLGSLLEHFEIPRAPLGDLGIIFRLTLLVEAVLYSSGPLFRMICSCFFDRVAECFLCAWPWIFRLFFHRLASAFAFEVVALQRATDYRRTSNFVGHASVLELFFEITQLWAIQKTIDGAIEK